MAASEVELGRGLDAIVRDPDSIEAEAAREVVAETVLWWRLLAQNNGASIKPGTTPEDERAAAARAYYAAKGIPDGGLHRDDQP